MPNEKPDKPIEPIHPGKLLQNRIINGNDLTVGETANLLGISRDMLSKLIHGKYNFTADMCVRVAQVFGENAEDWATMQMRYDLQQAEKKIKELNLKRHCHYRKP